MNGRGAGHLSLKMHPQPDPERPECVRHLMYAPPRRALQDELAAGQGEPSAADELGEHRPRDRRPQSADGFEREPPQVARACGRDSFVARADDLPDVEPEAGRDGDATRDGSPDW